MRIGFLRFEARKTSSHFFVLFFVISLLSGCAAEMSIHDQLLPSKGGATEELESPLLPSQGTLTLHATPIEPASGAAEIVLTLGLSKKTPDIAVHIYDRKCSGSYKVAVIFLAKKDVYQTIYFDSQLAWSKPLALTLIWDNESNYRLQLNNSESKTFRSKIYASKMTLTADSGQLQIHKLSITKTAK